MKPSQPFHRAASKATPEVTLGAARGAAPEAPPSTSPAKESRPKLSRSQTAATVVCAALLAASAAAFLLFVAMREIGWFAKQGGMQYAICACAVAIVFIVAFFACRAILAHAPTWLMRLSPKNPWPRMPLTYNRAAILRATAFVFVLWLPWIVLQYPTAMNNDTYNQLYQFQTSQPTYYTTLNTVLNASYIDHHPVFDTLVFGAFWSIGAALGHQNWGLFLYSLAQSFAGAAVLSASICYLERINVPKMLRLACLVLVALCPLYALWCATMVKDSLFSICFVWFFLLYVDVFRSRGASIARRPFLVAFVAASMLCVLTKKLGIYVVLPSLLVLLLYCRAQRGARRLAGVLVALPLVCTLAIPAVLYPALGGVAPGGRQESFGFAFQQMCSVVQHGGSLTPREQEALEAVLDVDTAVKRLNPTLVDPVKNSVNPDATRADYLHFVGAWFTCGLRHPYWYAESLFAIAAPLVCPGFVMDYNAGLSFNADWIQRIASHDQTGELSLTFSQPAPIQEASDLLYSFYRALTDIVPFNVLLSRGLWCGWVPLVCMCLAAAGGRRFLVAYAPIILSMIFVLLSPTASMRYVLPLFFALVLEGGLLCYSLMRSVSPAKSSTYDGASSAPAHASATNSCRSSGA